VLVFCFENSFKENVRIENWFGGGIFEKCVCGLQKKKEKLFSKILRRVLGFGKTIKKYF